MRTLVIGGVILLIGLVLFGGGCSRYNSFIDAEAEIENAWSKVQSAYQRRADLIPNLVNTVKGIAEFEQKTLTEITNARARATNITIDPSNITPDQLKAFQQAQSGLSSSLGRLLAVSENYPELKANQSFLELQSQLESTENRIKVERDRFNDQVTEYNKKVRRFPGNFYATIFGFDEKAQFEADASAQNAPKVEF
ncbi:MAG: LemA family protein [Saprospiraceae bacterium]|nr:LemA family protein [Saprospiraceae bacterium]